MSDLKEKQRRIEISELPHEIPDFESSFEPKESIIKKWITDWILSAISKKTIKENDILPNKNDISKYLGVSIGTVQNAIRYIEDEGYLKSKQRTGTLISNTTNPINNLKSTSKRDKAVFAIKFAIVKNQYKINKPLPSTRKMSEIIGISQNTIRLAYEYLCKQGILHSQKTRGMATNWHLKQMPQLTQEEVNILKNTTSNSLVDKISDNIKEYLAENFNVGDKIPTHEQLAKQLNVSIKTVHDAIDKLCEENIIITRRGRYGSILAQNPNNKVDNSMFMPAAESMIYSYQKIESQLYKLINEKFKSGDKLPSMIELAKTFDVSTNTIRKALKSLEYDGYITFQRGKYGGTYVIEKPANDDNVQYQWIAINPEFK